VNETATAIVESLSAGNEAAMRELERSEKIAEQLESRCRPSS
jgi:hypothetical protein